MYPDAAVLGFWTVVATLAANVALWPALPWRHHSGRWAVTAAFVVATCLLTIADGTGTSLFLTLIALANVSLAFGQRAGLITALPISGVLGLGVVFLVHKSVANALYQAFGVLLFAAFVLALTTVVERARDERDRADRLVAELAAAHEELSRYAERVHELAVAEERTRMARELHDSIGHHLTVIKVGLENAERYRTRDPDAAWQDVHQAKTLTADALQEIRRYVRAMRPPQLDGRRGSAALRELARSFQGTGLDVDVAVDGEERALDEAREIVLFRVLQESLTNALRHSGGTSVSVRLGFAPAAVRLSVADDGRGTRTGRRGFGLTSLADRVRDVGGTLRAENAAGGGFGVHVDLPELS
jgi:signal transduction histidine kinase